MSFKTKFVGGIVQLLTGTDASEVTEILESDPQQLRVKARRLLGLSVRDLEIIQSMKKLSPLQWSLEYLGIPRKVYDDYKLAQKKAQQEMKEEYPEIRLAAEVQQIQDKMPKIDGYINFQRDLIKVCQPLFQHTKDWRFVEPVIHLEVVRDVLDTILEKGSMTLADVFHMNIHLYYATFNAVMGTKIKKEKLKVAA